jgi:hypothetical protein
MEVSVMNQSEIDVITAIFKDVTSMPVASAERLKAAMEGLKGINWESVKTFHLRWEMFNLGDYRASNKQAFPVINIRMKNDAELILPSHSSKS